MAKKMKKINPNCPVPGCRASKPHAEDPLVKGLIAMLAAPEEMTLWTRAAMGELADSISRDMEDKRVFAWYSRLRLPEELYIRTLYALFVATKEELHHVLSGAPPNGFSAMYSKVNDVVFEGRLPLRSRQPGPKDGTFNMMDVLNSGAHGSFPAFMACISLSSNPDNFQPPQKYREYLARYCDHLDYMHGMFKDGKEKKHVLAGVKSLNRPREAAKGAAT
jgi:hypothetical protein